MADNKRILEEVSQNFVRGTSFMPVMSAELEFYLIGDVDKSLLLRAIYQRCHIAAPVQKEKGRSQYEIQFHTTSDPTLLASEIVSVREMIKDLAADYGVKASFQPKPFADQHGNALHVHLSLLDEMGHNVLVKKGEDENSIMLYALGGLLEYLPASMKYFCPNENSYARIGKGFSAPSTISWGGNNRTVALRLPTTTSDPQNRRIEHRVPSANSDPYMVLACILAGVQYGIKKHIKPVTPKIYGNADDDQYQLPTLPNSLEEAKTCFNESLEEDFALDLV